MPEEIRDAEFTEKVECVDHDFTDSGECVKCGAPQTLGIHVSDSAKPVDKFGGFPEK